MNNQPSGGKNVTSVSCTQFSADAENTVPSEPSFGSDHAAALAPSSASEYTAVSAHSAGSDQTVFAASTDTRDTGCDSIFPQEERSFEQPFTASRREKLCAFLMIIPGFVYALMLTADKTRTADLCLLAFVLLFIGAAAWLCRDIPRPAESWFWLSCMLLLTASVVFRTSSVFDTFGTVLILHAFAVWWFLIRAGRLLDPAEPRYLPLDAVNGFLIFPFGHFFLRLRTMFHALSSRSVRKKALNPGRILLSFLAAAAALLLFAQAAKSLMNADDSFRELISFELPELFHLDENALENLILRLFIALPVSAYLFGLLDGALRAGRKAADLQREHTDSFLKMLRKVSSRLWAAVLLLFCLFYLLFFAVQGQYLFGAFTRTLPDGFIVSEYARQGFFELCRVIVINFTLFWLITRSTDTAASENKLLRTGCTLLLIASMLFSVISLSKLALYIDCFGFTARRIQSSWMAAVLLAACIAALVRFRTGRKTMKLWMFFSAITLTALHFI